ncbi:sulfotransferase family 2 domain-containing protein [Sedimentitalea sp. JM2-8]|uniref:Sulfotransferase family 2 domain-containing protein n=1 Tax=Sedimentitalea xiamensis TaxID=3050037 RepID=A0ABT7FDI7_9RHOB|nr:sulfotransferase family 2 domain-containing protein [Sedimentitalea xiamensis]MDK3073180.1 sulfotransferase family 2 domain-containing protein [Sedimentitalea xiamensis]
MISHSRETIFVHVPKTGGQSIEAVFLDDLGLGWNDRAALLLRHNDDPARGPEKLAHLFAGEYVARGHIDRRAFDRYLKFAVVRHPFDRILSEYRYRAAAQARRGLTLELETFLAREEPGDYSDLARHRVPQFRFLTDRDGSCLVDHVLRFETLAEDIAPIFERIFGERRSLPHRNRSGGNRKIALTASQKDRLAERYRGDFEAFGYVP